MVDQFDIVMRLINLRVGEIMSRYIGRTMSLQLEAEVHREVDNALRAMDGPYVVSGQTLFDYDTCEFVTTVSLGLRDGGGGGRVVRRPVTRVVV